VEETRTKRPISITILGWLYLAVGVFGTGEYYLQFTLQRPTISEIVWITVLGVAAIVAGVFMLRGQGWARWLALAWMAAHVAISAFHSRQEVIIHSALLVLFGYLLLRRAAREYFGAA